MTSSTLCAATAAALLMAGSGLRAQTPEEPGEATTLESLHKAIQEQQHQIEGLTHAVRSLGEKIDSLDKNGAARDGGSAAAAAEPASAVEPQEPAPSLPPLPQGAAPASAPASAPADEANGRQTHEVKPGETLTHIAKRYKVLIEDLRKLNNITDDRKLQIGQRLLIPPPEGDRPPQPPPQQEER